MKNIEKMSFEKLFLSPNWEIEIRGEQEESKYTANVCMLYIQI